MLKISKLLFISGLVFCSLITEAKNLPTDTSKNAQAYQAEIDYFLNHYIPLTHDEDLIRDRLACIEKDIKLKFEENTLKNIKNFTLNYGREHIKDILKRKDFYFPIFEEVLKANQMPEELKYLAVIESSLHPRIFSYAAAAGLWQFMPGTGHIFGLKQDGFVDERMDPYKSTEAACKYLKYLYNFFGGNWELALAAYNCGEGCVDAAIKRGGGVKDFWHIYNYLPGQTRAYVPKFVAMMYVLSYLEEHNLDYTSDLKHIPASVVHVSGYTHLNDMAQILGVDVKTMKMLNPHLKLDYVPHHYQNYPIRFPADKKEYLDIYTAVHYGNFDQITSHELDYHIDITHHEHITTEQKVKLIHTVKAGESYEQIAQAYQISTQQLKLWNRIHQEGMPAENISLHIWIHPEGLEAQSTMMGMK
ncbi:MAG: LysM peptidoglycan-binding domain-containing protein [Cytophagales bacterium]|nr:MAG: LysM peptidoglycan-binding domain-containing protein [Cytophagales bacterium]